MHLHQILTGAANTGDYSFAAGSIESVHFVAYAAGYNVVILSGDFQRVQVLLSGNENDPCLLTCIDCTHESGKIAAGFGNQVCIYDPTPTSERSSHHQVNHRWSLTHTLTCSNEKITALVWHPKGDQLIVICENILQIWLYQYEESDIFRSNKVNFELDGNDIPNKLYGQKLWRNLWNHKPTSPIKHVSYSNDGALFATASHNDRLVKIWYRTNASNSSLSFTSTYLPHPRAVTYLSWRKTSQFFAEGTILNCLLTCCKDNICRIWCETIQQDESSVYINELTTIRTERKRRHENLDRSVQKLYKMRYNCFIPLSNRQDLSSPTSLLDQHAPHTPASLISSIPVLIGDDEVNNIIPPTTLSSSSSSSSASLAATNNTSQSFSSSSSSTTTPVLRFHLATTINQSIDMLLAPNVPTHKDYVFIVQWLNNKDLYNSLTIERFVIDMQRKSKGQLLSNIPTTADIDDSRSNDTPFDLAADSQDNQPRSTIYGRQSLLLHDSKHFLEIRTRLKTLIDEWKTSPDVIFSIHPVDGSVLLWMIDWLDQPSPTSSILSSISSMTYPILHRQVQVSFSARLPDIFPVGDALSLQSRLLLYCDHFLLDPSIFRLNLNSISQQHLPLINMITKHTNGTLNLWSLTFQAQQKFQSLVCITHSARMCGHHFFIRHIVCHPIVPLVLTSSCFDEKRTHRFDSSLILWSTEPIGPLAMTGGITELARMESKHNGAFNLIAWFPMVLPCMGTAQLRESPSVLFCASDGRHLRLYQVICNAKTLLRSQLVTSKSNQILDESDGLGRNNSIRSSPSTDLNSSRLNVVSIQSTARPSCVINLAEVTDSECVGTCVELVHIFPANAIEDRTEQDASLKTYYLVLVEKSTDSSRQSRIHMWTILVTYPDDDNEFVSINSLAGETDWLVRVQSSKVSDYVLPLPIDAELQSADVAFGHLSSSSLCYSDSSSSSPYLLTTIHSDGIIRFWTCTKQSSNRYEWSEWCGISTQCHADSQLKFIGRPLAVSNAYCGRLAVAFVNQQVQIGIYECESTGGTAFNREATINVTDIPSDTSLATLSVHFDWASIENGAHLLAAAIGTRSISIYSYMQQTQWTKLRTIKLSSINLQTFFSSNIRLKWVRGGLLLVGFDSELQVYSQWSSLKRKRQFIKPEPLIKPKRRQQHNHHHQPGSNQQKFPLKKSSTASDFRQQTSIDKESSNKAKFDDDISTRKTSTTSAWMTLDSIDDFGLFQAARHAAPVLPQYHPKLLLELVRFGKYRRVKAILAHLTRCIVTSVHSVEGKVEMKLMRSRTFSIANAEDGEPCIAEIDMVKYVEIDAVPLLPLFTLFAADHESENVVTTENPAQDEINGDLGESNNRYEDLFASASPTGVQREVDFKFDEDQIEDAEQKKQHELNKFRREILSSRNWSPKFDSRMVDLLVDYFQRVRLSNLNSLDQMYLLALADTLANAGNDSLANQTYAGEKPSNAMDDCGLRFLIDVKRYIYLSKMISSPMAPSHQSHSTLKHIITSASFAWAFHSDLQEDLLGMLPSMIKNKPIWSELELFGVGWWIRNRSVITRLFEKLGKAAFELHNDPLDSALYFLALKKKSLLYNLYKHVHDTKMQDFFKNDFTEERWLKAAQKNAFALLGKQRFEHAAAFFLLAGKIRDAIEVIINNLNDFQLALLIARLFDDDGQNFVEILLRRDILERIPQADPFLRSMSYWLLKDYENSLNTLLHNDRNEQQQQSIFIFYDFLKQHPLVIRSRQLTNSIPNNFAIERRLHFQTAYHYLNNGCPLLALEILAKLPPNMILSDEQTLTTNAVVESTAMDWSQPILAKVEDDELKLDWGDDEEEEEKKEEVKSPPVEDRSVTRQFDSIGQYMKLICCLKIVVEEMATLATGFEVVGGQLRHHLACWLEQEIGVIRHLCNLDAATNNNDDLNGPVENLDEPILSDMIDEPTTPTLSFTGIDSTTTSISLVRTSNFESKMKRLSRRRRWLKSNEHLLRTLVSFTTLHGMHGGGLASVRMELLLLMHELFRQRHTQLKYPIPFPTQVPLLIANHSGTLNVSNNSIHYIRDLTYDLLRTMNTWLTLPKITEQSVRIVALRDLSIALASCVYQSLCNTNEKQTNERIVVESFLRSYLYRRESVRLHRRKSVTALIERESPTTAPKDWPGIKHFANIGKDQDNNVLKLRILLVEVLVAVYMSLLVYALSTDDCNTLYRLLVRKWSTPELAIRLWYGVFGGGAKKLLPAKPNTSVPLPTSNSPNTSNEIPSSPSMGRASTGGSFVHKLLTSTNQPTQSVKQQPTYVEVFIPPRASIVNYFMAQVSSDKGYNSDDNEEGGASDEDDDDGEDEDVLSTTADDAELTPKKKQRKAQEREHTDSMSYSWVLMRYTIVRLVYKRLWAFFPHIGIERQEIPIVSPLIQQFLQNLNVWQDSLRRTLETFNVPPDNYLPLSGPISGDDQTTSGLAIHRYRTILDPDNTPFSRSPSAWPAKRLWIYLVNDEQTQGIFIKYIFKRKPTTPITPPTHSVVTSIASSTNKFPDKSDSRTLTENVSEALPTSNAKIIYRDSEPIHSFCVNNINPTFLAAGLVREIIELDISSITIASRESFEISDDEDEHTPAILPQTSAILNRDVITPRIQSLRMPTMGAYVPNMYLAQSTTMTNNGSTTMNNESQHVLTNRHAVRDSRKFANHPVLPHYLCGCGDGSVYLLNWSQDAMPRPVREAGKRVTKVELNSEGNKFGVSDVEGSLSLHVLTNNRSSAYMRLLTHSKATNDFVFLDSSTLLATCGVSSDHQNVAIWDTLMPTMRANITSFTCHEVGGGAQCLAYSQAHQLLISGGKRGDMCIFDLRQRRRLATSQAHDSHLKALALDPFEKFYATGSTEGNIKLWRLQGCEFVQCLYGEHSRRGFLHSQISGVNHLHITASHHLFSSGADGTLSVRLLTQFD